MLITLNSIVMTILCSTILIVLLSLLRMNLRFLEICSVSGIIILFLACMARLVIPIEFSWTKVVQIRAVYNPVMLFFLKEIPLFGNIKMEVNELLFVVWILGSLIGSVHLIRKYLVLNTSFSKLCCKPDEKANQIMLQIIAEYKNKTHPTVFKSDRINTPIGFGLIKKQIFIPDREYDDSDLKYILMHEYTHFRNRDTWVKLLINIICILYWWNPCVYLLRRKLDDCFEIRCDKRVVEEIGIDQSAEYLAAILRIFQGVAINEEKRESTAVNILPSSLSKLKERFTIVAAYKNRKRKAIGILIPIAIVTGLIVLSYSFIFQAGFDVPLEEVEDRPGAYSIDINDSYYYKSEDGKYYMKTSGGTVVEIDEQYVEKLKDVGFPERGDTYPGMVLYFGETEIQWSENVLLHIDRNYKTIEEINTIDAKLSTSGSPYKKSMNSWEELVQFLGFEPWNPLEGQKWVTTGSYRGNNQTESGQLKHCMFDCSVPNKGSISHAHVQSGYYCGNVRR